MRHERYLTNHVIVTAELDRARGHTGRDLDNLVSRRLRDADNLERTDYMSGSADDMELCALTSWTDRT